MLTTGQETMTDEFEMTIDNDVLRVEDFSTEDPDIVNYFDDLEEARRPVQFERVLRLGVLAARSTGPASQVDYVEKRFNSLQESMRRLLDDKVGGDFLDEIDSRLSDLRNDLELAKQAEEFKERTTLKGDEFEEDLEDLLSKLVQHEGDTVEFTGDDSGQLGSSKKGDFVIGLNDRPQSIVIEAKDTYYAQPKIESEMDEAIENRAADYGIFVARSIDNVPDHVGWMNEYGGDKLVIALGDGEDAELAQEILHIGYKWARHRIEIGESAQREGIDVTAIREEIAAAERLMKQFKQIKSQLSSAQTSLEEVKGDVDNLRDNIEERLAGINHELAEANQD